MSSLSIRRISYLSPVWTRVYSHHATPVKSNNQSAEDNTLHALYNNENQSINDIPIPTTDDHKHRSLSQEDEVDNTLNSVFDE